VWHSVRPLLSTLQQKFDNVNVDPSTVLLSWANPNRLRADGSQDPLVEVWRAFRDNGVAVKVRTALKELLSYPVELGLLGGVPLSLTVFVHALCPRLPRNTAPDQPARLVRHLVGKADGVRENVWKARHRKWKAWLRSCNLPLDFVTRSRSEKIRRWKEVVERASLLTPTDV